MNVLHPGSALHTRPTVPANDSFQAVCEAIQLDRACLRVSHFHPPSLLVVIPAIAMAEARSFSGHTRQQLGNLSGTALLRR